MSSVTCLFESADSPVSEYEQHQRRLTDIWTHGAFRCTLFQEMATVAFMLFTFSIHAQQKEIELTLPQLSVDLDNASISDTAHQPKCIAVDEWENNTDEYQYYLDREHMVTEEAPMLLQDGRFFGPLGNTMVVAISNALELPIIILSSASHYSVISIAPRVCGASLPLHVSFNQSGPCHYDAVSFKT